jgi:hypothetical protein
VLLKSKPLIQRVMLNSELCTHTRRATIRSNAAARFLLIIPRERKGEANNLITLFNELRSHDSAVNPARHHRQNPNLAHCHFSVLPSAQPRPGALPRSMNRLYQVLEEIQRFER